MSFNVIVKDEAIPYVKEHGEFRSEVYQVQTLQIPDEEAMKRMSLLQSPRQQVVPVRMVTIFLVADPNKKFIWAVGDKCELCS